MMICWLLVGILQGLRGVNDCGILSERGKVIGFVRNISSGFPGVIGVVTVESKILVRKLIEALDADKTIAQPYKNYAKSDALRLEAVIEKGIVTTNIKPPEPRPATMVCFCLPGQKPNHNCPVHGLQVS